MSDQESKIWWAILRGILIGWAIGILLSSICIDMMPRYESWQDARRWAAYQKALPAMLETCKEEDQSKWANICFIGPPGAGSQSNIEEV